MEDSKGGQEEPEHVSAIGGNVNIRKGGEEWFRTLNDRLWLKPDEVGAEEAAFVMRALRLRSGDRVLDAPCGAGRIAVHLARSGCKVTGIDLRDSFIRRARARFRKERASGMLMVGDLRDMDFEDEFEGVLNWGGSFGYFSDEENYDVLRRYARALRRGGRLLIDQVNREHVLRHFVRERKEGDVVVHTQWDARRQRILSVRTSLEGEEFTSVRLYTPAQLRVLFESVGLEVEAAFGRHTGEKHRRSSRRMILVGRKE